MSLSDELLKLHQLRQAGAISEQEFVAAKARLLSGPDPGPSSPFPAAVPDPQTVATRTKEWALILHLSQFAGMLVPLAGLIAPIVIWQVKKDEYPELDAHGKVVANWLLSFLIYGVVCILLVLIAIGIPLLIALGLIGVIFPIIGAVKANNGELWPYPLSINYFT
jgi:uncharacterized Tic20 family protein